MRNLTLYTLAAACFYAAGIQDAAWRAVGTIGQALLLMLQQLS
jgi:hypothetical protein